MQHFEGELGRLLLARTDPERYLVVDAAAPPNVVTELIKDRIREVLPDPVPRPAEAATGSFPAIPDGPVAGNGSRTANAANGNVGNAADVADRR